MRSTATVCVILACVGGALSTHDGNPHSYQSLAASPCGVYPGTSFHATNVNEIASKKYTTTGATIEDVETKTIAELWIDIKEALSLLEPLEEHKLKFTGGLGGWTKEQHEYVIFLSREIAGVDEDDMTNEDSCHQLQIDISTIYVNIEKLTNADRRTGDHTDEQHTDSSVSVNKRPWHSVAAALTIAGLANTIQKY